MQLNNKSSQSLSVCQPDQDRIDPNSTVQPASRVPFVPQPLPDDFARRLAIIYDLAIQRYNEHEAQRTADDHDCQGAA